MNIGLNLSRRFYLFSFNFFLLFTEDDYKVKL